jgi:prevent-host-death family protein
MQRIGVRELWQHASRYLALVAHGEQIEVTDRGRPVARLIPVQSTPWDGLVASQRVAAPTDDKDILDEAPLEYGLDATGQLQSMRQDER